MPPLDGDQLIQDRPQLITSEVTERSVKRQVEQLIEYQLPCELRIISSRRIYRASSAGLKSCRWSFFHDASSGLEFGGRRSARSTIHMVDSALQLKDFYVPAAP